MGYVLEEGPQKATVDRITLDVEGTPVAAYHARPDGEALGGVVLVPDLIGLRPLFEDICRRLATHGLAVCAPETFARLIPSGGTLGLEQGRGGDRRPQGRRLPRRRPRLRPRPGPARPPPRRRRRRLAPLSGISARLIDFAEFGEHDPGDVGYNCSHPSCFSGSPLPRMSGLSTQLNGGRSSCSGADPALPLNE